jgi:biopolymer transport protein ExbD
MSSNWDESPELNVTPLIDVMLVLLAILMVTAPTMVYEELIQLPKGSKTAQQNKNSKIEIRITKEKNIYIQKKQYQFDTFPDDFVLYAQNFTKETPVIISADERILYQDVMFILRTIKIAGFSQVSLSTNG